MPELFGFSFDRGTIPFPIHKRGTKCNFRSEVHSSVEMACREAHQLRVRYVTLVESLLSPVAVQRMSLFFGPEQRSRREPCFGLIAFCDEKTALTMQFLQAVRELTRFQKEQLDALIGGDADFGRFDSLIAEAVERKNEAKYALVEHIESHGCAA